MAVKLIAIAGVYSMALAGAAHAADAAHLSGLTGKVLVSRQGKLAPAGTGPLRPGDRVIATDGAARLIWTDGCAVTLKARTMLTVADASPCAGGRGLVTSGAASAQATEEKSMTAMQWGALGLSAAVMVGGLVVAADDLAVSN